MCPPKSLWPGVEWLKLCVSPWRKCSIMAPEVHGLKDEFPEKTWTAWMNAEWENQEAPTTGSGTCPKSHGYERQNTRTEYKSSATKCSENSAKWFPTQGEKSQKALQTESLGHKHSKILIDYLQRTSKEAKFLSQNTNFVKLNKVTIIWIKIPL